MIYFWKITWIFLRNDDFFFFWKADSIWKANTLFIISNSRWLLSKQFFWQDYHEYSLLYDLVWGWGLSSKLLSILIILIEGPIGKRVTVIYGHKEVGW